MQFFVSYLDTVLESRYPGTVAVLFSFFPIKHLYPQQWRDDLSLDEALALAAKVLIKTMDTATPSSERLEFATITRDEASKKTIQQMLTNREIDLLLKTAIEEQKQQQKESGGSNSSSNLS